MLNKYKGKDIQKIFDKRMRSGYLQSDTRYLAFELGQIDRYLAEKVNRCRDKRKRFNDLLGSKCLSPDESKEIKIIADLICEDISFKKFEINL